MRDDIENLIDKKMDGINPSLNDIYSDNTVAISKLVEEQNLKVEENNKRKLLLSILEDANNNGFSIPYQENMSLEELEELAKDIELH